jgi:PAS domain S-box-containing protein
MQEKPKRVRKHAFPYLILGLLFGLALVLLMSAIWLVSLDEPITISNLATLHLRYPMFLFIDFLVLVGALLFGWIGLEKDRVEDAKRHSEKLAQNHQTELQRMQESVAEQELKHEAEIDELDEQLTAEGKKFQDIEAAIRSGKQQWQGTFDAVDDLIILTDEAGLILRCNRATGEAFQSGYSQIVGRGIDELFLGSENPVEMVPGEKMEIRQPGPEVWYEASKHHLLVDGKQEGWVYIFRNVSQQKQSMLDQQRLTHYYELLVNNSPVAIVTMNSDDRIIDCNPAFETVFLYNKRESLGWNIDQLISPPDLVNETQGLTEAVRMGETIHCITRRRRKDGSLLDVEVFGVPMIMGGKQVGSIGLYHDVSELTHVSQAVPVEVQAEAPEEVEIASTPEPVIETEEAVEMPPPVQSRKRLVPIVKIEGIGPVYQQKLAEIGVKYTDDLLEMGSNRKGRQEIVDKIGISPTLVLKWVNMADLMRVPGIGEEYSELLEKAGVDTVKELRNRNPSNLYEALLSANEAHKLVRRTPHLSEVEAWIKEAKELPPVVEY